MISVSGIDGCGKTTLISALADRLTQEGYDVRIRWLRFNHFFTKPLLAFCRFAGLTRYESEDGIRVGYHEFYRSRVVSWLFLWLQCADALRVYLLHVWPQTWGRGRRALILDRFVVDILVDMTVATRIQDLDRRAPGRFLRSLVPGRAREVVITRRRNDVLSARPECRNDRNFDARVELYTRLADRHGLRVFENTDDLESAKGRFVTFVLGAATVGTAERRGG